ncbi:MAG: hypothetical protein HRT86_07835 [Ilumatobacteraceae bacterium]|nr:hypothetical protein [Ilumatobacteraceae bacterium]
MNRLTILAGDLLTVEFDTDDQGVTAANPILPPWKEVLLQTLASAIVFGVLYKFAWPAIKKSLEERRPRVQNDLDEAAAAVEAAEQDATDIRAALGDLAGERRRLFEEADVQAAALLDDGRSRLDEEIQELYARADAEVASAANRGGDDLRNDIANYSAAALERVSAQVLDDPAQQRLIEDFISRVGASS